MAGRPLPTLSFRRWLGANAPIAAFVYLLGVALFLLLADRLDNDFSREARAHHKWLIARVHLGLLPAYIVIGFVHALLSWPVAHRLHRRRLLRGRGPGRFALIGWAAVANLLVFILGVGPQTTLQPGSLDVFARALARFAAIDLYKFKIWHLQEAFTAIVILLLALFLTDQLRAALRTGAGKRLLLPAACAGVLIPCVIWIESPRPVPRAKLSHPNVIVVASDSLRFDHLSCHGYPRRTSPAIDAIAAESVDFKNFYVSTASTLESWGTMMTGQYPANHGLRFMFISKEDAEGVEKNPDTLPKIFRRAGYETAVVGDWAANCFSLVDFGFEKTRVSDVQNLDVFLTEVAFRSHILVPYYFGSAMGEKLVPRMRQVTGFLDADGLSRRFLDAFDDATREEKPFFGVLFVASTHLPYQPPYPWNVMFADPNYRGPNRYSIDFKIDEFIQHGFAEDQPEDVRRHIVDLYDGGVAHFDSMVKKVADHLRATGQDENTVFVISSDHGDDLYDPGVTLGHGTNFFGGDQTTRIPMIMRLPRGMVAPREIRSIGRSIDLAPTLIDIAGVGPAPSRMDGRSLREYFGGDEPDLSRAAFAETCYMFYPKRIPGEKATVLAPADKTLFIDKSFRNLFVLKPEWRQPILDTKDRMMRTDRWKLIYIRGENGPIWRLFDMVADPTQRTDLSKTRPEVLERMTPVLNEWMKTGRDQPWTRAMDVF